MVKADMLRRKNLHKAVLVSLKIIPMLLALFDIINTIIGLLGLECHWISYFGGVSLLTIAFLYLASYVFQFCAYHRMFLHYVLLTNTISVIDFEFGIPISNYALMCAHVVLFGLFLFLVLYFYRKEKCCRQSRSFCLASSRI